jgi:uncharacterized protein (TIGR02246 family)
MRLEAIAAIVLGVTAVCPAQAQSSADEAAVRGLPQAFAAAFNSHDGHQLAQIAADDIDFVTVGAWWLHGKSDFEKYHARLLNGRFHGIQMDVLQVAVRFLRPDIAIVHWSWTGTGDRNPDGTARSRRYGMMTTVAEKRGGSWLIVASQNDNSFPGRAPEAEGITSPIPMPDQVGPQPSNPRP